MFDLQAAEGARFTYCVDFSLINYANISFFDADNVSIPFHLSLRQEGSAALFGRRLPQKLGRFLPHPGGSAVFNRRSGKDWHRETQVGVQFLPTVNRVDLCFGAQKTTVKLNGKVIFRLSRARCPLGENFTRLAHQGGVLPLSLRRPVATIAQPENAPGELSFDGAFALSGWGFVRGAVNPHYTIDLKGCDTPLDPILLPQPEIAQRFGADDPKIGVYAALPGRIWQDLPAGADLQATLMCNGIACGPTAVLSRADICAQIELIAATEYSHRNGFLALTALEHLRFGGFLPDLSTQAQAWAFKAAEFYRLDGFLPANMATRAVPTFDPQAEAQLREFDEIEVLRKAFTEAANRAAPNTALLDLMPELPAQGSPARQKAYLAFGEIFSTRGGFPALFERYQAEELPPLVATQDAWHNSTLLPFLYAQNRFDDLRAVVLDLARAGDVGIATAGLAWVFKSLATDPPKSLSRQGREALVQAFARFLSNHATHYWGCTPSQPLVEAAVALVAQKRLFRDAFYETTLLRAALQTYGLTPAFWDMLGADTEFKLQGTLAIAAQHAGRIIAQTKQTIAQNRTQLDQSLRFFEALNAPCAHRFRIELSEGAALQRDDPDLLARLYDGKAPATESALRHLAFPHLDGPSRDAETLAALSRAGVHAAYSDTLAIAHQPLAVANPALQSQISRRIGAALDATQSGDLAISEPLLQDLRSLADRRNKLLGLGLLLVLLQALLTRNRRDEAARVLAEIKEVHAALRPKDLAKLSQNPAVISGLHTLQQGDGTDPIRATAIALLPSTGLPFVRPQTQLGAKKSPLFDTVVMVISCQAYLDTRIPVLKSAWIDQLAALGIPYVVVVGGADGPARLDGNVLCLDAPDDYEGLPQKVLAAIEWVESQTDFGHILKIDDDCFLDAESFFHGQNWRKFDYYGRKLLRMPGQMNRSWHAAKSRSLRGQLELDKSPEPSVYADGGSGYMLSRRAMVAVKQQAASVEGQKLLRVSFMEDKVIGDLLALADIHLENEGYFAAVQRRSHAHAIPVSTWGNSFWPSRASGVSLVHLDNTEHQPLAAAQKDALTLYPLKVWPSHGKVKLGYNSSVLEVISPPEKLARLNTADLAVIACTHNEMTLLPQFLAHYRQMGVKAFLIADNISDDGSLEYLADQPDVALFSVDSEYRDSHYGVVWQQTLLSNFRINRWSLIADIDELLITSLPDRPAPSLADITAKAEAEGADALRVFMLDLYPKGSLAQADMTKDAAFDLAPYCDATPFLTNSPSNGSYGNSHTWTSALRHRLIPNSRAELFVAQKAALLRYRPWMRLSAGLHYIANAELSDRALIFGHFKYHAEFLKKAQAEVYRRQHFNNAEEYRSYLALNYEGREVLFDPAVSVHWSEAESVRRILAP